jgi:hypothetical protein
VPSFLGSVSSETPGEHMGSLENKRGEAAIVRAIIIKVQLRNVNREI